ncbi:MAG: hypothetical protein KBS81_08555, partial [Spirochaetales bacterium]|nr:hypothetical protein [Candidatus Physcosoma equi]
PLVKGTFEEELRSRFTVGGYIFFLNCEQARYIQIYLYTSIPAATIAPMGIKAYNDLEKLLSDADISGQKTYIVENGSTVLPYLEETKNAKTE